MKMLIVEDDVQLRGLIERALRAWYPYVEIESTGYITQAHNLLLSGELIDAAIVDGELLDGYGADLVEAIVRSHGGPPFLGISGRPDCLEALGMAGCQAVLHKPFSITELTDALNGLLFADACDEDDDALVFRMDQPARSRA